MGKRQKLGILSYPHIGNRITKDLSAAYHCQLCQVFQSPLNCLWQIVYKSKELSLALLLFLSSLRELSLSYFVAKSRQSYWHILELIKGVALTTPWAIVYYWSPLELSFGIVVQSPEITFGKTEWLYFQGSPELIKTYIILLVVLKLAVILYPVHIFSTFFILFLSPDHPYGVDHDGLPYFLAYKTKC